MRRNIYSQVLKSAAAALAVLSLTMCSKTELEFPGVHENVFQDYTLSISSDASFSPEVKTGMADSGTPGIYNPFWTAGDKIQIYIDEVSSSVGHKYTLENPTSGTTATFTGSVGSTDGDHTVYGFYPASALVAGTESGFAVSVEVPDVQNPTLTSFDPACDILAAGPMDVSFTSGESASINDARFARQLAILKIVPLDKTGGAMLSSDKVLSVKVISSATVLTGRARLNLKTSTVTEWVDESSHKYVKADYLADKGFSIGIEDADAAIMMVAPGTMASGSSLEFRICTDSHVIAKTITLPSDVNLAAGRITTLKVKLTDANVQTYGWAELPEATSGADLELCKHSHLPSNSALRNYSFLFDKNKHCSLWVAWPLHSCYMGSATRTNNFGYDPDFIDNSFEANIGSGAYWPYNGSSYSHARGHQMPSAERTVSAADNNTTFYATNMTPQLQSFNGNIWEQLESMERSSFVCSDTLYVVTGPYFDPGATPTYAYDDKGKGKACQVPTHYWKIFLRTKSGNSGKKVSECSASELQCVGFWFEHVARSGKPVAADMKSVKEIEDLTGFTFFPNVPNAPKSTFNASDWGL